jgi:hypothetical protein
MPTPQRSAMSQKDYILSYTSAIISLHETNLSNKISKITFLTVCYDGIRTANH